MRMQRESEARAMSDPFDIFGGFGNFGGFSSGFGKSPFDDPFFTRRFSSVSSRPTPNESPSGPTSRKPVIHELNSDDELEEQEDESAMDDKEPRVNNNQPFVDHPDEEPEVEINEHVGHGADLNRVEGARAQTLQYHSCKVTYGGVDGAYYSSSATRRMTGDGALMEECKEADRRTGEAKHRISRGIHNKGHSLTRKLNPDGKVDTLQTLHNLNEDELERFEDSWRGNSGGHIPSPGNASITHPGAGFDGRGMSDWAGLLPSSAGVRRAEASNASNGSRPKKVVRINIE